MNVARRVLQLVEHPHKNTAFHKFLTSSHKGHVNFLPDGYSACFGNRSSKLTLWNSNAKLFPRTSMLLFSLKNIHERTGVYKFVQNRLIGRLRKAFVVKCRDQRLPDLSSGPFATDFDGLVSIGSPDACQAVIPPEMLIAGEKPASTNICAAFFERFAVSQIR